MDKSIQFKPVIKDKLFYDKYQYCVAFTLDEASALKTLDHGYINAVIERRKIWRQSTAHRWNTIARANIPVMPLINSRRQRPITDQTTEDLHHLTDVLLTSSTEYKLVTSVDQAWVYSNSLSFIKKIGKLQYIKRVSYSEAKITRPKDTIKLKTPTHTHRSYFKSVKLTPHEKESIAGFLNNQKDYVRVSPSLISWLSTTYHRTQDYFFIDHTGESWLLMLALIKSGLIRKTSAIIPA